MNLPVCNKFGKKKILIIDIDQVVLDSYIRQDDRLLIDSIKFWNHRLIKTPEYIMG